MSKSYSPSVAAFLEEQDMIRAHRDRLGQDLADTKTRIDLLTQELRQSEHRGEFLQAQVNRITDQRDIYSRTSTRVVAKVEVMLKTITMLVEDLADEIRRAQFEETEPVMSEGKEESHTTPSRRGTLDSINDKKYAAELEQDEIDDPDEERNDVDAERIGRHFGAGFPDDYRYANQDEVKSGRITGFSEMSPSELKETMKKWDRVNKVEAAVFRGVEEYIRPSVYRDKPQSEISPTPTSTRMPPPPSFRG